MFHLGWFNAYGHSPRSNWKDTRQGTGYDWREPELYQDMARVLERGAFDMVVFADTQAFPAMYGGTEDAAIRYGVQGPCHDPVPLVAMIAAATSHIGLVPTISTTFYPPFMLSRLLGTLDHLTRGRIGWNIVTSTNDLAAQNYGLEALPESVDRYDAADEYVRLCNELWDSWGPGSVVMDREKGIFADPSKVTRPGFVGKWFRSRGPGQVVTSPQRRPVAVQAGQSPEGRAFASMHAEAVINNLKTVAEMKEYHDDIKSRVSDAGRDPDSCKVFFSVNPTVGETDGVANERYEARKTTADVMEGWVYLSMRADLSGFNLDEPFPPQGMQYRSSMGYWEPEAQTLREAAMREAWGDVFPIVGGPAHVADVLEDTMRQVGGDGYVVRSSFQPGHVVDFVDLVVPELRRRGLVRDGYSGGTFRENLLAF